MEINWFASDEALRAVSPMVPSMIVSIMLTPMVIRLCMAMGTAMDADFT